MVLSIEERIFLVEYVFREGNRHTDLVQEQFAEKFPVTPVPNRDHPRMLNELKICNNCVHKKHLTNRSEGSVCE
jgi:hypothetical protein